MVKPTHITPAFYMAKENETIIVLNLYKATNDYIAIGFKENGEFYEEHLQSLIKKGWKFQTLA
jgi:predicted lactoylglutathione lyase